MTIDNSLAPAFYKEIIAGDIENINLNCLNIKETKNYGTMLLNNAFNSVEDAVQGLGVR